MNKKIIALMLCVMCVISNCLMVFASSDGFIATGGAHLNGLNSVSSAWEFCKTYQNGNIDNCSYVARYTSVGSRFVLKFYVFDNDCILVRGQSSQFEDLWYFYVYKYDGSKMVQCDFLGDISYEDDYISCYDSNFAYCYVTKTYGCTFDNSTDAYEVANGVPIATSVENALLYYQTMDVSYLENASEFLDKPEPPSNVSFYQASDENSIWVYWENYKFYTAENVTAKTCYDYSYFYTNASDEKILLDGPYSNSKDYVDRYQVGLSYLPVLNYDNGFMIIRLWNEVDYNGVVKSSDIVSLLYYPHLNYVSKIIFDVDTQEQLSETVSKSVVDYKTYNESFTGGNITLSDIPMASDGDFSLLSGLSSGFGLLGNTGLLGLMASLFTYLPAQIIELIVFGVKAVIAIALFKFLIH